MQFSLFILKSIIMRMRNFILLFFISSLFLSVNSLDRIQKRIDKEIKSTFDLESYSVEIISVDELISKTLPSLSVTLSIINSVKVYNSSVVPSPKLNLM